MKTTHWCTTQYSIPQTTAEKYEKIKLSTIQQTLILSKTIKHHLIFQKFGESFPYYTFLSLHPIQKNRNFLLSGNRHACPLLLAPQKPPPLSLANIVIYSSLCLQIICRNYAKTHFQTLSLSMKQICFDHTVKREKIMTTIFYFSLYIFC